MATIKDKIDYYIANHFMLDTVVKTNVSEIVKAMREGVRLGMEETKEAIAQLEKQGGQKPAEWSEEDEMQLDAAIHLVSSTGHVGTTNWLKSLKDRVHPKQEWSEEDAKALNRISTILVDASEVKNWWKESRLIEREEMIRLTDFLQSLRPQNKWKPNIAQLNALSIVSKGCAPDDIEEIKSLYDDLKKLMEE